MAWYADRIFPWLLDRVTRGIYHDRESLLREATGRVLEIGAGTGANLSLYPPERVTDIVALEPSAAMLAKARARIPQCPPAPRSLLVRATAEELPFADESFDTVVACLVFCTIPDSSRAAREMVRVLRPRGRVLVFEHIRSPEPAVARWQDRLDPLWTRFACGCHLNRSTAEVLREAGLRFERVRSYYHPKMGSRISARVINGVAVKAGPIGRGQSLNQRVSKPAV